MGGTKPQHVRVFNNGTVDDTKGKAKKEVEGLKLGIPLYATGVAGFLSGVSDLLPQLRRITGQDQEASSAVVYRPGLKL
jgi:hypothetical protein